MRGCGDSRVRGLEIEIVGNFCIPRTSFTREVLQCFFAWVCWRVVGEREADEQSLRSFLWCGFDVADALCEKAVKDGSFHKKKLLVFGYNQAEHTILFK